ncbi:Oligopeptide transport ATP-binding protein AppF [Chlamydiales bacterium SCGC AG-110-P3]|nr:Oligopeptide transport ATP-binding protein AppF [Chlamydiales bacterium SCGC AG-110-P3]
MVEPLLQVTGLKKYFPQFSGVFRHQTGAVKAVDGVDFQIMPGEILGMVGESGCGKSTTGRAAIRLIEPTAGQLHFDGQDLLSLSRRQLKQLRTEMQMIFQDPYASLNPRKTIANSIGEALWYHGKVKESGELRDRIADILKKVGLSPDAMNRYPHQFSGGQQQRVCIGRAIALEPRLIVCDEAVSALDVSVQAQILNLLSELKATMNLSYLFISHDLSVVRHLCDRVVVLYFGKVVEVGIRDQIFHDPQHEYTKQLLSAIPCTHPSQRLISIS